MRSAGITDEHPSVPSLGANPVQSGVRAAELQTMRPGANAPEIFAGIPEPVVVLVEPRVLIRECLSRCLKLRHTGISILAFGALSSWHEVASRLPPPSVIILSAGDRGWTQPALEMELKSLAESGVAAPVIVLSSEEEPGQILDALDTGVKGFIPTSVSFDVALEAVRLVLAGGVFIPASSLMVARNAFLSKRPGRTSGNRTFTDRQAAVIEGIRQGKANKIIAYELNMRESTVKVHVRNIMRKLNAKNRTEVAYLVQSSPAEWSR
jgi:DNA-binding NarL/FixJ family response regulator